MATKAQAIRDDLSDELLTLADILEVNLPGFDGGSLKDAANECEDPTEYGQSSWGYSVDMLQFFDYEPSGNLRPEIARAGELSLEVDLRIAGRCDSLEDGTEDPLHKLELNLLVWGEGAEKDLLNSWHLDRHISEEGDEMYTDHPLYHFQFGGEKMWNEVQDYGELLLPEAPRIAFPPMDVVLAVNFVLANFFGNEWNGLIDLDEGKEEYRKLVADAQNRLWRPYAQALSTAWNPGPFDSHDWPPGSIWPQLIDGYMEID
jgi:hypothetical protein